MGDQNSEGRKKNAAAPLAEAPETGKGGKPVYEAGAEQGGWGRQGAGKGDYAKGGLEKDEAGVSETSGKGDYQGGEKAAGAKPGADDYGVDDPGQGGKAFDDQAEGQAKGEFAAAEKRSYEGREDYADGPEELNDPAASKDADARLDKRL